MITREMTVAEVLALDEKYQQIFERYFMTCAGCPGADNETLQQAAEGHGVDLDALLADLNKE